MTPIDVLFGPFGDRATYTCRRVPWRLLVGAWAVCATLVLTRAATADSAIDLLPFIRLTSVTFAAVGVFALDDPAGSVTASTRAGRLRLRMAAVAATGLTACGAWLSVVVIARAITGNPHELPVPGLLVELVALSAAGWTIAATLGSATGGPDVSTRAAGALVILVALTLSTPRLIHWLWVGPGSEWERSHIRWAVIACAALATFAWISRDPARRRPQRHRT